MKILETEDNDNYSLCMGCCDWFRSVDKMFVAYHDFIDLRLCRQCAQELRDSINDYLNSNYIKEN